jgi:hypothetical protein
MAKYLAAITALLGTFMCLIGVGIVVVGVGQPHDWLQFIFGVAVLLAGSLFADMGFGYLRRT